MSDGILSIPRGGITRSLRLRCLFGTCSLYQLEQVVCCFRRSALRPLKIPIAPGIRWVGLRSRGRVGGTGTAGVAVLLDVIGQGKLGAVGIWRRAGRQNSRYHVRAPGMRGFTPVLKIRPGKQREQGGGDQDVSWHLSVVSLSERAERAGSFRRFSQARRWRQQARCHKPFVFVQENRTPRTPPPPFGRFRST